MQYNRRFQYLNRWTVFVVTLLTLACFQAQASSFAPTKKGFYKEGNWTASPNIIFILADDFSSNLLPYMPNLRAMQEDGAYFSNYFVTDSLCCPSRASIFTGNFPHNTKVLTNKAPFGGFEAFVKNKNESHTFAVALQNAGYRTALLGKYLNDYEPSHEKSPGWSEWVVAGTEGYKEYGYDLNENGILYRHRHNYKDYMTDVLGRKALDFIKRAYASPHPFMIEIATYAPHEPFTPAFRDKKSFTHIGAPRTPAFGHRPEETDPEWIRDQPELKKKNIRGLDEAFRNRVRMVQSIDRMIGQIRQLVASHKDNNTYIFFSSDNGLHMGEYSLHMGKKTPFDIDIHVPLVVAGPGIPKGKNVDHITENIDLAPTFAHMGQASFQADGKSLVPLLMGEKVQDWRDLVLIEHDDRLKSTNPTPDPDRQHIYVGGPPSYNAIRSGDFMYVEYRTGESSYYDLKNDPYELHNLDGSLSAQKRKQLHESLMRNHACKGNDECWKAQHFN